MFSMMAQRQFIDWPHIYRTNINARRTCRHMDIHWQYSLLFSNELPYPGHLSNQQSHDDKHNMVSILLGCYVRCIARLIDYDSTISELQTFLFHHTLDQLLSIYIFFFWNNLLEFGIVIDGVYFGQQDVFFTIMGQPLRNIYSKFGITFYVFDIFSFCRLFP